MTDDGSAAPRIRVLIIDDHQMVSESLERVLALEPTIEVVGTAGTAAAGVGAARRLQPDVVLLDYLLPDGVGVEPLRAVKQVAPRARVLLLTGAGNEHLARAAVAAGGAGYLQKTEALSQLSSAIRSAADGQVVLSVRAPAAPGTARAREGADERTAQELSARELEVLARLAAGASSRHIADTLGLSVHTVRKHVQNILVKLDVHSKLEAVATARRKGFIGPV